MESLKEQQAVVYPPLRVADRCDSCPAQAFVRVHKEIDGTSKDLLLCGHDFAKHEPALAMDGWNVQDERHRINAKPMSGSPENYVSSED